MNAIERADIAKRNKRRARTMENKVAALLHGKRVTMSGAGSIKGDVIAPLDEYRSIYVECKLTEKKKENDLNFIIPHLWFYKAEKEAIAMRHVFSILVIHWWNIPEYWIFVPLDKLHFLEQAKGIDLKHWITDRKETGEIKRAKVTGCYRRNLFLAGYRTYDIPDLETGESKTWIVVNMDEFVKVLHHES